MSEDLPHESVVLTETQKMGISMRVFGFSRIALILSQMLIVIIASSVVAQQAVLPPDATYEEIFEIIDPLTTAFMSQIWVTIYSYCFEVIIILGLGYFVLNFYQFYKINPDDQNLKRIFILFISGFSISVIGFVVLIFTTSIIELIWVYLALSIIVSGCFVAGFLFLQRWGMIYERQLGAGLPILSSRLRRIVLGEIFILMGLVFNIFTLNLGSVSTFMGFLAVVGEVMAGANLIRSGKLLRMDAFPQPQMYSPGQPRVQQQPTYPEYPEYKPSQKLIPDKAYFCPSCGAKLESESQDFCMKCGNAIPKPKDN